MIPSWIFFAVWLMRCIEWSCIQCQVRWMEWSSMSLHCLNTFLQKFFCAVIAFCFFFVSHFFAFISSTSAAALPQHSQISVAFVPACCSLWHLLESITNCHLVWLHASLERVHASVMAFEQFLNSV